VRYFFFLVAVGSCSVHAIGSLVDRSENSFDPQAQLMESTDGLPINKQSVLNYNLYTAIQKNKTEDVVKALLDGADPDCYLLGRYPLTIVETAKNAQLLVDAGANPLGDGPYGSPLATHIRNYIFNELLNEAEELAIIYALVSSSKVTRKRLEAIFERMDRFKTFERFQYLKRELLGVKA